MIIPVYKPLGASSHQLAAAVGRARNEKATHTGTLDPMAEGVLVVLTGEDRFRKSQLSTTEKTYTFKMILGVQTDSHDLLGIAHTKKTTEKLGTLSLQEIELLAKKALSDISKKTQQVQPLFSAGRTGGTSFFEYGKKKQPLALPKNKVAVSQASLDEIHTIDIQTLHDYISTTIATVSGDFRQAEILTNWDTIFNKLANQNIPELPIMTCTVTVTKRTYIRGLVRDIASEIAIPATTFSIVRTRNGPFTIEDCLHHFA